MPMGIEDARAKRLPRREPSPKHRDFVNHEPPDGNVVRKWHQAEVLGPFEAAFLAFRSLLRPTTPTTPTTPQ